MRPWSSTFADKSQEGASLDRIYNDPSMKHALDLFERFSKNSLAGDGLRTYLDTLPADAADERIKLEQLVADSSAPNTSNIEADLSTRSGQLVWAAGLGHLFQSNPPGTTRAHPIWKTLTSNPKVSSSLSSTARFIDLSATNRNATMDWGTPGSWFWFAPDKNHINIDLFHTLLTGFADDPAPGIKGMAHASGVMMHEIGHSQLTTRFTDKMIELRKREMEIVGFTEEDKEALSDEEFQNLYSQKCAELSPEKRAELVRTKTEFSLRMNVMNAAEDNCVNQYAANHSREFPHDFEGSLNVCNVILQGSGLYLKNQQDQPEEKNSLQELLKKLMTGPRQKEIEEAGKALANLSKATALSFYASNGLFDKSDAEDWKRLGINPDEIKAADTKGAPSTVDHFLENGQSDFDKLLNLNVGPSGMAHLQPQSRDRWLLRSIFARSIETYTDRRCRIVDEIWDKYAAHHAQILIDAAEQNAQNKTDKKQQKDPQSGKGNDKPGGNTQPSPQDNQDDPSPSQGSGDGQQPDPQNGGKGEPGEGKGSPAKGSKGNKDDPSPSQGNDSGSGGAPDDNTPPTSGSGGGGDVDDGKPLPSTPEEARRAGRKGNEGDVDPDKAKTIRDLARDAKGEERRANPSNDNADGSGNEPKGEPGDLNMDSTKGGREKGVDLATLAQGDWREFRKRINELDPVISRVANDFAYIRDRQKQTKRDLSKRRETLPRGNNLRERLDMTAHMNLAVKRATGQRIEEPDLRRWRMDQVTTEPTSVELWLLCDGSGSMDLGLHGKHPNTSGGRRIDSAVQSMAVLFEAGRRADFDVFAGMWGDETLRILAAPGDRDQKIGQQFETAKNGINSGTHLSPSFEQAIAHSAKQETGAHGKRGRFAGMTHFLILSDGELASGDIAPFVKMVGKLFRHGPAVSVDIAVLGEESGAEMKSVVSQVKRANPAAAIDIIKASNAKDIPVLLAQKIKQRFERSAQDLRAVPDAQKREAFTRAHRAIMNASLG